MNNQNDYEQEQLLSCLNNPKNRLQYQFYKLSLALTEYGHDVVSVLKPAIETLTKCITTFSNCAQEYQRLVNLGAEKNPRLAFLAFHAKKQRIRNKNLKRLYEIGCLIEKRGDIHNHQTIT